MPTYSAPCLANSSASDPMPHPISNTRFPAHRWNPANSAIWGSTRYLRSDTSRKNSAVPVSLALCLILHGCVFQYLRIRSSRFGCCIVLCRSMWIFKLRHLFVYIIFNQALPGILAAVKYIHKETHIFATCIL